MIHLTHNRQTTQTHTISEQNLYKNFAQLLFQYNTYITTVEFLVINTSLQLRQTVSFNNKQIEANTRSPVLNY